MSTLMSAKDAIADIPHGATLAVGGFGICGIPNVLLTELAAAGTSELEAVSNNAGLDDRGLGLLLGNGQLRRIIASYVGENKEFARQYLEGELEVELTPQGTLAERLRAGGSGIGAFFTRTGVGTVVADGGMPWKYTKDGAVEISSPPKETREIRGETYVLEHAIEADFALVRAAVADEAGNLRFHETARNFNPLAAMSGRVCIVEAEKVVPVGELAPDDIHLPSVYVHRLVELTPEQAADKKIEKETVR
ncbi:CoA transferase subunit A [Corynebacterium sp. 320]|uniref:CoA transferase subunit A n=1 Tax=Corynebacterium TaxID=1716 RepID=UPI00125CCB08|nr:MULTISPECIES: CoA transferase subunit A [Corynebacterium]KAB1504116.1 CoA transferase subunit A [Corynebacterium sp. 320]KAB3528252.1 CoA transferase subunit A [Corynebacterium sp. 250]QNP91792.1 CoA transferase subunit A [Corynebacterium zhongnanshanii]